MIRHSQYWYDPGGYLIWMIIRIYVAISICLLPIVITMIHIIFQLTHQHDGGSLSTNVGSANDDTTATAYSLLDSAKHNDDVSSPSSLFFSLAGCALYGIAVSKIWNDDDTDFRNLDDFHTSYYYHNDNNRNNNTFDNSIINLQQPLQHSSTATSTITNQKPIHLSRYTLRSVHDSKVSKDMKEHRNVDSAMTNNVNIHLKLDIDNNNTIDVTRNNHNHNNHISTVTTSNQFGPYRHISTKPKQEQLHQLRTDIRIHFSTSNCSDNNVKGNRNSDNQDEGDDCICPICYEEYIVNDDISYGQICGHSYHSNCIDLWLNNNNSNHKYTNDNSNNSENSNFTIATIHTNNHNNNNINHNINRNMMLPQRATCPCCRQELVL